MLHVICATLVLALALAEMTVIRTEQRMLVGIGQGGCRCGSPIELPGPRH
jgi:hypothetical protein